MTKHIEVSDYLCMDYIIISDEIDKDQAIELLIEKMAKSPFINNYTDFRNGILKREKELNTYIGNNIAIPHTRLASIEDFVIGILICKKGIPYSSDQKANIIFMIAASDKHDKQYIQLLSRLILRLKDNKLKEYLLNLNSESDVYNTILKAE
jgi:mannitol/fructose-specific phosphotransferase system IIA component (Ntr-type)